MAVFALSDTITSTSLSLCSMVYFQCLDTPFTLASGKCELFVKCAIKLDFS